MTLWDVGFAYLAACAGFAVGWACCTLLHRCPPPVGIGDLDDAYRRGKADRDAELAAEIGALERML